MNKKIIPIIISIALVGGGFVYKAIDQANNDRFSDCDGQEVEIETEIENKTVYFCGNNQGYEDAKLEAKNKLIQNTLRVYINEEGEVVSHYVTMVLLARNDNQFWSDTRDIMIAKYDPVKKEFDGTKLDHDFLEQLAFYVEMASIKCGGNCVYEGETIDERIYNSLKI